MNPPDAEAQKREREFQRVRAMEEEAATDPRGFQRKALFLFAGGLVYLLVVLGLVVWLFVANLFWMASGGGSVVIIFFCGIILWFSIAALIARVENPEGLVLDLEVQAPGLARELESLEIRHGLPRATSVRLNEAVNASALRRPLWGLIGFQRFHIQIGYPLLALLDRTELRSVLAHELAHLSSGHSGDRRKVARFYQLGQALSESSIFTNLLLRPFVALFGWRIDATAALLSRAQEYEADAREVEIVGPENVARCLLVIELAEELIADEITEYQRRTLNKETPPTEWVGFVSDRLRELDFQSEKARWILGQMLAAETAPENSHPCIADRIAALGIPGRPDREDIPATIDRAFQLVGEPRGMPALNEMLSDPDAILAELETRSHSILAEGDFWGNLHLEFLEQQSRVEELRQRDFGDLSEEDAWDLVSGVLLTEGTDSGFAVNAQMLERFPDHPRANFAHGRRLLERGDAEGLAHLDKASSDWMLEADALSLRQLWHRQRGELEAAESLRQTTWQKASGWEAALGERDEITGKDAFLPHDLPAGVVDRVAKQCSEIKGVAAIYLAKRDLRHELGRAQYVLGFETDRVWWKMYSSGHDFEIVGEVIEKVDFPHDLLSVPTRGLSGTVRKRLKAHEIVIRDWGRSD